MTKEDRREAMEKFMEMLHRWHPEADDKEIIFRAQNLTNTLRLVANLPQNSRNVSKLATFALIIGYVSFSNVF